MEDKVKLNINDINEITIIYDFSESRKIDIDYEYSQKIKQLKGETINKYKIFGENFVQNNKDICKIIVNNEKKELCSYLENYKNYLNKDKLEIKLTGINNIIDSSYMFSGCVSLISLPDISKWNIIKVENMRGIFFYCKSLSYLDDISGWKTDNITDLCGAFDNCSSLISLPDISKWNTEKVANMNSLFYKCSNLKLLPDFSIWNTKNVDNL